MTDGWREVSILSTRSRLDRTTVLSPLDAYWVVGFCAGRRSELRPSKKMQDIEVLLTKVESFPKDLDFCLFSRIRISSVGMGGPSLMQYSTPRLLLGLGVGCILHIGSLRRV